MGQKANPKCLRLGIIKDWDSSWFGGAKAYSKLLYEDYIIRQYLSRELDRAGIAKIEILRKNESAEANIYVAKPGIILGKNSNDTSYLKDELKDLTGRIIKINILEYPQSELNPKLLGEWIASQLKKRLPFRRVMKMTIQKGIKAGAKGIRISCSGRLGGAEIARREWYREGTVPLHTFRANIDYAVVEAHTTYGTIGIKVWIYSGEILKKTVEQKSEYQNRAI